MNDQDNQQDGQKELSREEVEAALEGTAQRIDQHIDGLKGDLQITKQDAKTSLYNHPLVSVGGSLAAGLLVGLIVGGSKKDTRSEYVHRLLVDEYMDAVADDVHYDVAHGDEPRAAVYKALQDRVPLIFYEEEPPASDRGFFKQFFDLFVKTAFGFAVKTGLDYVTMQVGLEEYVAPEQEQTTDDVTAVSAAASEESSSV